MRTFILFALLAIFSVACGSGETADAAATDETEATTVAEPQITLTDMTESPDFPDAAITSMSYKRGMFTFGIDGGTSGYTLGTQTPDAAQKMCANSAQGQHIHLIINDEPYAAKYDASFEYDVPDGDHYLLAFLSRSYHESIKHPSAAKVAFVSVKDKAVTKQKEVAEPMLFYSRPKGTYTGQDTENIMLDFYLANVTLGNDYKVKAEVAGETFMIDTWKPFFLKGLPMGEHTVTLTLVDAEGNTVDTPLNPVSRTITLAEDKAEG